MTFDKQLSMFTVLFSSTRLSCSMSNASSTLTEQPRYYNMVLGHNPTYYIYNWAILEKLQF